MPQNNNHIRVKKKKQRLARKKRKMAIDKIKQHKHNIHEPTLATAVFNKDAWRPKEIIKTKPPTAKLTSAKAVQEFNRAAWKPSNGK